jgi:hypothetical protein
VARILIVEPHPDVSSLFEVLIQRLGHEPVRYQDLAPDLDTIDLAIVEPGDEVGFEAAKAIRARGVGMVFVSVFPPEAETLAMRPIAHLVKPFGRHSFAHAVQAALSSPADPTRLA